MRILVAVFLMSLIVFVATSVMTLDPRELASLLGVAAPKAAALEAKAPAAATVAASTAPSVVSAAAPSGAVQDVPVTALPSSATASQPPANAAPPVAASLPSANATPDSDAPQALSRLLKSELEQMRDQELQLKLREESLELIREDLQSRQVQIQELRKQVDSEMRAFSKYLTVQAVRSELRSQLPTVARTNDSAAPAELAAAPESRVSAGSVFDQMPSADTARVLVQMAHGGRLEPVVEVLASMRERNAAKVLAEIAQLDGPLASKLGEQLRGRRQAAVDANAAAEHSPAVNTVSSWR